MMHTLRTFLLLSLIGLTFAGCTHETTYKKTLVNETGQSLTIRFFSQRFPDLNADITFPDNTSRVFFTHRKTASDPGKFFDCHYEIDSVQVLSPAGAALLKDIRSDANWTLVETELKSATEFGCEFSLSPADIQ